MPLPIKSLDDRRFEDIVAEARQRLQVHLPDATQMAEGDPLYALTDLFAWMTESVIYRANLIPERQRRAFLNLLHLPMRPAMAARGIVSNLSSEALEALGISASSLRELYGARTRAFQPVTLIPGQDRINLSQAQDKRLYCLLYLNDAKLIPNKDALLDAMAGTIINIGLAPDETQAGDIARELPPRTLKWHLAWQANGNDRKATYLPLEVIDDSSRGGRQTGVARLRLPKSTAVLKSQFATDSKYAGINNTPPPPPADVLPEQVIGWISLSAPTEENLELAYLGVNAVEVVAQTIVRDQIIGIGNGRPGQSASLKNTDIEPDSLVLEVSERGSYVAWRQVEHFAASHSDDRVYRLDPASGTVTFGDGLRGRRPESEARIRAAFYRSGGGTAGNLPAGSIKQLLSNSANRYELRHEWPTRYGVDAETVSAAEQRISAHLSHRNRAVTLQDFQLLARDNPISPVARAEAVSGLLPGNQRDSIRFDVPGVVSVFVMPPAEPALGWAAQPSAGLLRDVYHYLDARKMLATELYVLSPEFIDMALAVSIEVYDPGTATQTLNAVQNAVLEFLWALPPGGPRGQGWPMGRTVEVNELKTAAARVDGVLAVNHLRLFYQAQDDDWLEAERVALLRYQLPKLLSIEVEQGEQLPPVPAIAESGPNGTGGSDADDDAMPVPVIPDLC
ncbi:MAG: putative baseplate assembly protein [Reinekea sp.]